MTRRLYWFFALMLLLVGLFLFALPSCQGTCDTSESCSSSEYCSIANGSCLTSQGVGFCKSKPTSCPSIVSQVCGCDGKTYQNACTAAVAGTSVANTGPCAAGCGGGTCICGGTDNTQCGSGFYCDYPQGMSMMGTANCLTPNAQGTCTPIPMSCTTVSSPVCGCDGKTYDNSCLAASAGISVAAVGACTCTSDATAPCAMGEYCDLAVGTCGAPGATGTCHTPPADCKNVPFLQVCGCDSKTYDNACEAAKAGVSVQAMGACTCGGPMALQCGPGNYCALMPGACLMPNAVGSCSAPPDPGSCPIVKSPVCGCDNKPYDNACKAAADGNTSVATNSVPCP